MRFEEYCESKKINANNFLEDDMVTFLKWKAEFELMGQDNFTQQKKFLINPTRSKYPLVKNN